MTLLACLALPWGACRASAQDGLVPMVAVHVSEGAPCLTRERLSDQVRGWLGGTPVDGSLEVFVDEDVTGERTRFQLRRRGQLLAERTFWPAPPGCPQREAVMALAIALVLKDTLLEEITAASARVSGRTRPRRITVGALLSGSAGVLSEPALGGTLGFGWGRERWFGLRLWLGASSRGNIALSAAGGSFRATLVDFGIEGCAHLPPLERLRTALCAGVATGLLRSRGSGFAPSYDRLDGRAAVLGSVLLDVQLTSRLSLLTSFAMQALLTPIQIEARGGDQGELLARRKLPTLGAELSVGPALVFR